MIGSGISSVTRLCMLWMGLSVALSSLLSTVFGSVRFVKKAGLQCCVFIEEIQGKL